MKVEIEEEKLLLLLKHHAVLQLLVDNGEAEDLRKIRLALESIEECKVPEAYIAELTEKRVLH